MKIFPLSVAGKVVLILIAIFLGLIFWGMKNPAVMKRFFCKRSATPAEPDQIKKTSAKK